MKNSNIYHVGFYTKELHHIQKNMDHLYLLFQLDGLEYLNTENFKTNYSTPFCYLFFPGDTYEFIYNKNRKNWVAQFDHPGIKCISNKQFSFEYGSENIILPRYLELSQDSLLRWRNKFDALVAASEIPVPHERMLAQIYLLDLFKYLIEAERERGQASPAAKLKRLIDMPENMHLSLLELCGKCGYSDDHLRILFKNRYEISPYEYRIRRIMVYAMELICKSTLMISDIADKCGFKHLSHFSASFRKTHGMAPREALKRFRYQ